jgi:hypothetical protein
MIPSLFSDEFQAALKLANDSAANPAHRQIANGAIVRIQHPETEIPITADLDWRRGYIDPSLPLRIST